MTKDENWRKHLAFVTGQKNKLLSLIGLKMGHGNCVYEKCDFCQKIMELALKIQDEEYHR